MIPAIRINLSSRGRLPAPINGGGQYLYSLDYAQLRRKGRMSRSQWLRAYLLV